MDLVVAVLPPVYFAESAQSLRVSQPELNAGSGLLIFLSSQRMHRRIDLLRRYNQTPACEKWKGIGTGGGEVRRGD